MLGKTPAIHVSEVSDACSIEVSDACSYFK